MMAAGIHCQKTMSEPTDHQLLWEFADAGNEKAFGRLVDRHLPLVFSAARRKLGDAALAQDVSQQVLPCLPARSGNWDRKSFWLAGSTGPPATWPPAPSEPNGAGCFGKHPPSPT